MELLDDIRSGLTELAGHAPGQRLGVVGFCFGGTMTWALLDAGEPRIAAAVAFYGTTPDPSNFAASSAAVLGIYAGLDERVNASRSCAEQALVEAGLTHRVVTFDGVDHAFFNDTGPRFDEAAAALSVAADARLAGGPCREQRPLTESGVGASMTWNGRSEMGKAGHRDVGVGVRGRGSM